ncbi:hypothetical protein P9079_11135 [Gallibacterium anatis]|uniref:hypothetical protein n=1 Tax=Gallibacterium anatis TaxID=750 RepID=UPI00300503D5
MNEIEFRNWLTNKNVKPKIIVDTVSRLKRIEREINNCDIDEQYRNDKCEHLLKLFLNMGNNTEMKMHPNTHFPIGKYYMSTYRRALKQYIEFLDNVTLNNL